MATKRASGQLTTNWRSTRKEKLVKDGIHVAVALDRQEWRSSVDNASNWM